jgi:hypothetical protein
VENDEFSEILTFKRAKNSLFECKWGGVCRKFESFVGNLESFVPPPTGKSEFPPLLVHEFQTHLESREVTHNKTLPSTYSSKFYPAVRDKRHLSFTFTFTIKAIIFGVTWLPDDNSIMVLQTSLKARVKRG